MAPEWISGNIFIRAHQLARAGESIPGHRHAFDHTTIVFTGAVHVKAVRPDGTVLERDFRAPAHFLVQADTTHAITAIEPFTEVWCVYSHRDPQGRISQVDTGWSRGQ